MRFLLLILVFVFSATTASTENVKAEEVTAQDVTTEDATAKDVTAVHQNKDTRPGIAPDIREDESKLKAQKGNFVAVPIPFANPTLDEGLVAGAAYFYGQSEEEKRVEPASVTALGGMYSSNDSRALGLAQQNYWRGTWRFTGLAVAADLRLSLLTPEESASGESVDWHLKGEILFAKLARKIKGNWYGGLLTRYVDADQNIEIPDEEFALDLASHLRYVGAGFYGEYDTRDMPLNSYTGQHFTFNALFNDDALGSDNTYQSYSASFRSYHQLSDSFVLGWELQSCQREGVTPVWDACRVKLRGFATTDYMGKVTASGQAEARWHLSKRWGAVAFAGVGYVGSSYNGIRENDPIPSYGVGVRFSVLPAKRINIRVDYARSVDSDAVVLSVGEAF
jgi:hypothetical protein